MLTVLLTVLTGVLEGQTVMVWELTVLTVLLTV